MEQGNREQGAARRVALVTGAGRGIGLGIAQALARAGCDIAVGDIHEEEAVADALASLREAGADVLYCRADVSDAAARAEMLDAIKQRFGALHVLVNNAGVAPAQRADILAGDPDPALVGAIDAGQEIEQGGFARATAPQ